MPTLGCLVWGLAVHFGARETKGHGVPEVMEAIVLRDGQIRKSVAFVKSPRKEYPGAGERRLGKGKRLFYPAQRH